MKRRDKVNLYRQKNQQWVPMQPWYPRLPHPHPHTTFAPRKCMSSNSPAETQTAPAPVTLREPLSRCHIVVIRPLLLNVLVSNDVLFLAVLEHVLEHIRKRDDALEPAVVVGDNESMHASFPNRVKYRV